MVLGASKGMLQLSRDATHKFVVHFTRYWETGAKEEGREGGSAIR